MRKDTIFKLGDRVYAPFHGYGVVTAIHEDACVYPIEVTWNDSGLKNMEDVNTFTADGLLSKYYANTDTILTVVKGSHKRNRRKEMSASKFKVGDRVYAPFHKYGTIVEIVDTDASYPITVRWDESRYKPGVDLSTFTEDGYLFFGNKTEDTKITKIEGEKMGQISGVIDHNDESTIERMEDALSKKVEDAVNPAHYKVEGLPEAIDIINHLMHREQYEGFLWGNILKYTYRYGRKGDKKETAGKIEWYAQKLKELGECESE